MCFRFSFIFIAVLFEREGFHGVKRVTQKQQWKQNSQTYSETERHTHVYTQTNNLKICSRFLVCYDKIKPTNDLSIIVIVRKSTAQAIDLLGYILILARTLSLSSSRSTSHSLRASFCLLIRCEWLLCIQWHLIWKSPFACFGQTYVRISKHKHITWHSKRILCGKSLGRNGWREKNKQPATALVCMLFNYHFSIKKVLVETSVWRISFFFCCLPLLPISLKW